MLLRSPLEQWEEEEEEEWNRMGQGHMSRLNHSPVVDQGIVCTENGGNAADESLEEGRCSSPGVEAMLVLKLQSEVCYMTEMI